MPGKHAANARQQSFENDHPGPMRTQSPCKVR